MENETHALVKTKVFGIFLLSTLLELTSCDETSSNPGIIQKEKMVQLMGEVYLVEMHYQKFYGTPAMYKPPLDSALTKIFKTHGVSQQQYEKSFSYYASNPAGFMEMNEQIIQQYNEDLVNK